MTTISSPKNLQKDRVYAPATSKKRNVAAGCLLHTRTTCTKSVVVSLGVSKLGHTHHLIFVDLGIKPNGAYYQYVLLKQDMLSDIRVISGDFFIYQQDKAPAQRAHETVALLQLEVPAFISPNLWPLSSPDLNQPY